jgi:hypothetical protein
VPIRKRNPPVRTRIPHSKRPPLRSPPQNQRHLQQHRRNQLVAANLRTPRRRIPKIPQKSSIVTRRLLHCRAIAPQNRPYHVAHGLSDTAGTPHILPKFHILSFRGRFLPEEPAFSCLLDVEAVLQGGQPNRSIARVSQQRRHTSNCLNPYSALSFV